MTISQGNPVGAALSPEYRRCRPSPGLHASRGVRMTSPALRSPFAESIPFRQYRDKGGRNAG
jgi:hypothetical protein